MTATAGGQGPPLSAALRPRCLPRENPAELQNAGAPRSQPHPPYIEQSLIRASLAHKGPRVKAIFVPAVMYGCERWTTKKAEHGRTDAFFFF